MAHAGRKASTFRRWDARHGTISAHDGGWLTQGPSAITYPGYDQPQELSPADIAEVVAAFAAAARRAVEAGFDLLETLDAVRAAVGANIPVVVSFSATDWVHDGWSVEKTIAVMRWLPNTVPTWPMCPRAATSLPGFP